MATVYVPKGTKRKSKIEIQKTAEAYLTNGRYDQRKSAMIADAHKLRMIERQKVQAKMRKDAIKSASHFAKFEALIEKTLIWEKVNPNVLVSAKTMMHYNGGA